MPEMKISDQELESLLDAIKKRFHQFRKGSCQQESMLDHIRSLGRWEQDSGDYPEVAGVEFPEIIHIAYAVCHPDCGVREFIVDGSTQECQHCGRLMFRSDVVEYTRRR